MSHPNETGEDYKNEIDGKRLAHGENHINWQLYGHLGGKSTPLGNKFRELLVSRNTGHQTFTEPIKPGI